MKKKDRTRAKVTDNGGELPLTKNGGHFQCVSREKLTQLRGDSDVYLFDHMVGLHAPKFLRPCLQFELRPGELEALEMDGNLVFLLVQKTEKYFLYKEIFVCSPQMIREHRLNTPSIGVIGQFLRQDGELYTFYFNEEKIIYQAHVQLPTYIALDL
jgi:hypothetical protein